MSKGKQNDISNINDVVESIDVNVLRRRVLELEKHNVALQQTLDKFTNELSKKEDVISHLQSMLGASVPIISTGNLSQYISDEEIIAEQQLERLKNKAKTAELTLEEVKKFDLLVKNKRLAQGSATSNNDYKDVTHSSKKKLLSLASKVIPEDSSPNMENNDDDSE